MRLHLPVVTAFAGLALVSQPAHAHLMPKQQGTINLRDSAAFAAFSIPVSALRGWDRNVDGRMSPAELLAHRTGILAQLDAGITIASVGDAGRRDLLLPSVELEESDTPAAAGGTHLLVLVRQTFRTAPHRVQLQLSLFGTAPDEREFIITARDHGAPEVAVLRVDGATHVFFAPVRLRLPSWRGLLMPRVSGSSTAFAACVIVALVAAARGLLRRRRSPAFSVAEPKSV